VVIGSSPSRIEFPLSLGVSSDGVQNANAAKHQDKISALLNIDSRQLGWQHSPEVLEYLLIVESMKLARYRNYTGPTQLKELQDVRTGMLAKAESHPDNKGEFRFLSSVGWTLDS
jgi:hypothetical protein